MHKLYNNDDLQVYSLKENNRLVKSPQSQEESQYGTDIQLREYPIEGFENTEKKSNDLSILFLLLVILSLLSYFIIN